MIERLMDIDRTLMGDGVRESLEVLREKADFDIHEVPTGTQVFDWTVPQEWVIKDALLYDDKKNVWINRRHDPLHVMYYSQPIDEEMDFDELKIHTSPVGIPYRTSYYEKDWGFCMKQSEYERMDPNARYRARIDAEFKDGSLTYGEKVIEGDEDEYIISTYCCHPNMVNDNTAGMAMWADLLKDMGKTRHTYRFVIAPETIGMVTYLATHDVSNVKGAIVLTHVAGPGEVGFKQSFEGNSYMDRVARSVLPKEQPFSVRGSDERQLSSPGFRIPTIVVNKGGLYKHGYHTSHDRYYRQAWYDETLEGLKEVINVIESDRVVESTNPNCEPMMSKRNLYPSTGGNNQKDRQSEAHMSNLFYSGKSLLEISETTGISVSELSESADILEREGLIK